jgi:hypothetical protein
MKVGDILKSDKYRDLLNTEEWKQFSNSIRRDRQNACECCRRTNVMTQTHHIFYDASIKPWEHDPQDVVLLCEGCHKEIHQQLKSFRRTVFRFLRPGAFEILNKALSLGLTKADPLEFVHAVLEMAESPNSIQRFAYAKMGGKPPIQNLNEYNATERDYNESSRRRTLR